MKAFPLVVALLSLTAVALVLASPLALRAFGGADGEWERLSLIGQTYGAVSALIAVLALVGVAVTLVFQARETRRAVEEGRRQAMAELLRMAMDDPDLDACWGPVPEGEDRTERRQQLYTNMIVTQWGTAFRAGALPEARLRAAAEEMFRGGVGRAYWARARKRRLSAPARRADRRFNEILEQAYTAARPVTAASAASAAAAGSAGSASRPDGAGRRFGVPRRTLRVLAAFGAGAAVGAGAVAGAGPRRRPGRREWRRRGVRTPWGRKTLW
ncbi:DUF6082 family protein [Nocardiopsis suaedae]|uniref:DUF6082 family protein n=1 Tax=Nocardiopsis suaedae TaxID=3018444 RepID=A0ABT4TF36_9ACTN|nr:DUF6082 family protein [Nocardiopsis suaedae]MDA2803313.1 DUF6082 family protein [Nocardiopsis suaedae]